MAYKTREKANAYRREYYKKHSTKEKAYEKAHREATIGWITEEFKELLVCKCGENRWPCLDFHHNNPTEKEICVSNAIRNHWSKERIRDEIRKCTVMCSNCHRMFHYNLRNYPSPTTIAYKQVNDMLN